MIVTQNPGCVPVDLCNDLSGDYFVNVEDTDAICPKLSKSARPRMPSNLANCTYCPSKRGSTTSKGRITFQPFAIFPLPGLVPSA